MGLLRNEAEPSTHHHEEKISDELNTAEALSKDANLEEEKHKNQHDIFYSIFLNEVKSLTIKAVPESDLLNHLNLHRSQLREWLKRAVEEEQLKKLTRPVRYLWNKAKSPDETHRG